MKNLMIGAGVGAVAVGAIWGLTALFSGDSGKPLPPLTEDNARMAKQKTGVLDLICELHLDIQGQLALGIQGNEPPRVTIAQIDFDQKSGWYQGKVSISEARAGTLTISGDKLVVTRPAMFERFGVMINKEEFVIDRTNGDFMQSLGVADGRTVKLIRGTCAKVIKPPF